MTMSTQSLSLSLWKKKEFKFDIIDLIFCTIYIIFGHVQWEIALRRNISVSEISYYNRTQGNVDIFFPIKEKHRKQEN